MSYVSSTAIELAPATGAKTKIRLTWFGWVMLYQCLICALPVLKLLQVRGIGHWSWLWVTAPIWGPAALLAAVLLVEHLLRLGKFLNRKQVLEK